MKQNSLIAIIILAGISIAGVSAYSGSISAAQGNFNNLLVTGTCSGCGAGEGSFTSYNTILNETITGSNGGGTAISLTNTGSSHGYDSNSFAFYVLINGTIKYYKNVNALFPPHLNPVSSQSLTGEYVTLINPTSKTLDVYKNDVLLQKIGINVSQFNSGGAFDQGDFACNISPNGKYIGCETEDSGAVSGRIIVFQGS